MNAVLTSLFAASALSLFVAGGRHADWTRLSQSTNWAAAPGAVTTMLQLLVFGEILPTVCALLTYNVHRIRSAILFGSLIPVVAEVGWAALGIGLVKSAPMVLDPVDVLLAASPVQTQVRCLGLQGLGVWLR